MLPIVSQWQRGYPSTPAGWAALRAQFSTYIYPSGLPATMPSSVAAYSGAIALPAEAASMRLFTVSDPGGRTGGTPLYGWHMRPNATPVNVCSVYLTGHESVGDGWSVTHLATDGSSPIRVALAAGCDVLVYDMPGSGQQPATQQVVVNSVLTTFALPNNHNFSALDADGGPCSMRMFFDHIIRGVNQMHADYSTMRFVLSGHSGGGLTCAQLGIIDARYLHVAPFQGQLPRYVRPNPPSSNEWIGATDWEQYRAQPLYRHGISGDYGNIFQLCASVPNRRTMICNGLTDATFPGVDWVRYNDWMTGLQQNIAACDSTARLYCKTDDTSGPDPAHDTSIGEITDWLADMRATMGI